MTITVINLRVPLECEKSVTTTSLNETSAILKKCIESPNQGLTRNILGDVHLSSQP